MEKYDLIVIGSGPAGEKAAVKAAYFGYRVALVEREPSYGGAGTNTGTLPSKTLKETALFFSGRNEKGLYGVDRVLHHDATIDEFMYREKYVVNAEVEAVNINLHKHKVDVYQGVASFDGGHILKIEGDETKLIEGEYFVVATGSYPFHPTDIPFDGKRVHDSDTILKLGRIPTSLCILGAGVIGMEYATLFATMGTKIYLINKTDEVLTFVDKELTRALIKSMEKEGTEILFNDSITSFEVPGSDAEKLNITLKSGKVVEADMFLFAAGRNGRTAELHCDKVGLALGPRDQVIVDEKYRSNVPYIYAVGDVIGFPALASTSMDQGRVAVAHIFNTRDLDSLAKVIPLGIYTIPEISMVGITEEEAIAKKMNYCTGQARHKEMARGRIMGASEGLLKLVFTKEDCVIRGVHIFGPLATELVHYGLSLVENKKNLMQVISTVFNYPTLHDLYKYAAYDALGNLSGHKIKD